MSPLIMYRHSNGWRRSSRAVAQWGIYRGGFGGFIADSPIEYYGYMATRTAISIGHRKHPGAYATSWAQ
ncbi:hypothetical protein NXW09_29055, partial [Bacteroides ovatus]|nr:hypothetical protein [Bacteroides ovatus]